MPVPPRDQIPEVLLSLPHWVVWRTEAREGSTLPTKVPYSLVTGRKASSINPLDWTNYQDSIPDKYDGIGFVLTKSAGFTGIDLDDCLDDSGGFKPWSAPIIADFKHTYYEISPSGTGVKIFAGGLLPDAGRKIFIDSSGIPTVKSMSDGGIEMYDSGRFFAVTGLGIGPREIPECQTTITELYRRISGGVKPRIEVPADGGELTEGSRHPTLLAMGGRLRNMGFDREALLASLRSFNELKCSPPKPELEIVGIVNYLMGKPPQYRLTPMDYTASLPRREATTGSIVPEPEPQAEPVRDILTYTETLLAAAIASKNPMEVLGRDTNPSPLIVALAQAGSIKQHEARRRIKDAFGKEIPMRELDARIKAAEIAAKPELVQTPYLLNDSGSMLTNLANAMTMLRQLPLVYNSFTCRPILTKESPWGSVGNWGEQDDMKATEWVQRQDLNCEWKTVAAAADAVAKDQLPWFHPVVSYLKALKWDGEPRLNTWLHDYLGAPDNDYVAGVSAKWMISAVKRVMEPGCQADYALVLEGAQGKRKSTALRVLGGEWFTDDLPDVGTKDSAIQIQGKWIVELSELDALGRAEWTTVKAWIARPVDRFRTPYGRRSEDFPRQCVFAGTTNKYDWGKDDTGLRRFWPVIVGDIKIDGLRSVRDQLWAEAVERYLEGELPYFSEAIETLARAEQHSRQDQDAWTDVVQDWVEHPNGSVTLRSTRGRIYLPEVLHVCLGIQQKDWTQVHHQRVKRILRVAGYQVRRATMDEAEPDGRRLEFWVK